MLRFAQEKTLLTNSWYDIPDEIHLPSRKKNYCKKQYPRKNLVNRNVIFVLTNRSKISRKKPYLVLHGMEWNGMEWNGMEWNGMEWNGMEWNG